MKKLIRFPVCLMLLILVACGSDPTPTPIPPTDTAVPPPAPTDEPTVEPTAVPTEAPEVVEEIPAEPIMGEASVAEITIEQRGEVYVVYVQGSMIDSCTEIESSAQTIAGSTVQINLTTTRPADAACAQVITEYTYEIVLDTTEIEPGEYDVEVNGVPAEQTISIGSAETDDATKQPLTQVVWLWQAFEDSADGAEANDIEVVDSQKYQLVLWDDGTFSARADCNQLSGNYTVSGNSLTFELGPQTLVACQEGSLSDQYIALLGNVVTYITLDGQLFLNLMADAGNMIFADGGSAGAPSADNEFVAEEIVGKAWKWVEFTDPATGQVLIPDPDAYQIALLDDGRLLVQADCNTANGLYELDGMGIEIIIQATTLAVCPEGSLGDRFIWDLNAAALWFMQDDFLFFDLKFDSGTMKFELSEDAPLLDDEAEADSGAEADDLSPDSIQLDLQGLADSYAWSVRAGYPASPGPGGTGMPPHIVLTFDGEDADEALGSNGRYLYIFPVESYEAVGGDAVLAQIERLQTLIDTADGRTTDPDNPMPILPPPQSFMNRWAQFADLDFVDGRGVRYVSEAPNRQAIGPWTNEGTAYYYQGLTADGKFYISLHWPVATEALPNTPDDVPQETIDASTNPDTYPVYLQETKDVLNALPPSAWEPDLVRLDEMIASLSYQP